MAFARVAIVGHTGRVEVRTAAARLRAALRRRGLDVRLEQALAESMDARGFALQTPTRGERVAGVLTFIGAIGLGGAVLALIGSATAIAAGSAAVGTLALIVLAGASLTRELGAAHIECCARIRVDGRRIGRDADAADAGDRYFDGLSRRHVHMAACGRAIDGHAPLGVQ